MARFGYKLMSEEHPPPALVENAVRAEDVGFDFVAISDHFAPWLEEEGHASFAWSVIGAIACVTDRIRIATAVTCPHTRYHPAIVAQAAATVSLLSEGRFSLGLGAGERLNEHVTGAPWPSVSDRQEALAEALDVIRMLLRGGERSHRGRHVRLDEARLFDPPDRPLPILVAAGGLRGARLAAEKADGMIATEPRAELVDAYREAGGRGPLYAEVPLCWAASLDRARATAHRYARWSVLGWRVLPELVGPRAFDAAASFVRPEDLDDRIALGPDPERHRAQIQRYLDAGFDHLVLLQVGPDQAGFFDFFQHELAPALGTRVHAEEDEEAYVTG